MAPKDVEVVQYANQTGKTTQNTDPTRSIIWHSTLTQLGHVRLEPALVQTRANQLHLLPQQLLQALQHILAVNMPTLPGGKVTTAFIQASHSISMACTAQAQAFETTLAGIDAFLHASSEQESLNAQALSPPISSSTPAQTGGRP
ncbi:hypothetical protein [Corynebacterium anserum]|uniref:Uncharacterized protein n=1 Tax=Corynebacterium anserum TaxID=2684406 RepID=A0A7G7YLS9_9CORY|nr:hypothetical protein [Corynebacterium anserum]MBC2681386.1 hypothetical protein [Corynebacterium anserum]QNH95449.1 hypothetical protein GP473_00895 [Corynebacterium anserum]